MPIAIGDPFLYAEAEGRRVVLVVDEHVFADRRRRKTAAELAGVRRAAQVTLAAMAEAAAMLRAAVIDGSDLVLDGQLLRAEAVRSRIRDVCSRGGAPAPQDIMVKPMGPVAAIGHDPGATGLELYARACEVFEQAGHPTQRTKAPGETLREGFYFSLGHGVGLEVHEEPALGRTGTAALIEGDVIAVEPGTVIHGVGGTRVEDLLIVTADGSDRLTGSFPYGLVP